MVKVGIIGAGFMGGTHAACYGQLPDVKVAAVADVRADRAKTLAEKTKSIPFFGGDELLKRQDIAVVDICLPSYLHKEYVLKAAAAGKDVICEKPIALSPADADEMTAACKAARVRFMVAHVIRFWNEYRFLKDVCDRQRYGRLLNLSLRRVSPLPTWSWENWLHDGERSGGALVDLHIHDTDFLNFLFGRLPERLVSRGCAVNGAYQHIFTTFVYPDGVVVSSEGGWDLPAAYPFMMAYTANFEKAVVEFNSRSTPTLTVYEAGGSLVRPTFETQKAEGAGEGNIGDLGGYYQEIRYFIEHVTNNKQFGVVTPEDARDSLALVLKEKESADTGAEVVF